MNHIQIGRRPHPITYVEVSYTQKDYVVGFLISNDEEVVFVFDKEDYESIRIRNWHRSANMYMSSSVVVDGTKKELYMNNLVMGRMDYNGKGQTETVDHINRIGFDNRKENLRIATQSEQNINQRQRQRSVVLPEGCGIAAEEIPRHIWYMRENGSHGDRFAIQFKSENFVWKSSSSKRVGTREKLHEAIEKLKELYLQFPHLDPDNIEKHQEMDSLTNSFTEIINIARVQLEQT